MFIVKEVNFFIIHLYRTQNLFTICMNSLYNGKFWKDMIRILPRTRNKLSLTEISLCPCS